MASEAEFWQEMQPPDIEEVKVISSLGGEARLNNSNANPNETRHSAEKLDEVTARLAIKRLLDQGLQSPIKVCINLLFMELDSIMKKYSAPCHP